MEIGEEKGTIQRSTVYYLGKNYLDPASNPAAKPKDTSPYLRIENLVKEKKYHEIAGIVCEDGFKRELSTSYLDKVFENTTYKDATKS